MSISFSLMQILFLTFFNLCIFSYYYSTLYAGRITHLPGFNGSLPFYLKTGYVTVNEESGAEFFYYFVESERNPIDDPLILWLIGGPYCSGFSGLTLNIGPLKFKVKAYDGTLPTLISNPYSWTKVSSIIFLDWPVGTGFSFSRSMVDYHTDETQSTKQIYNFLIKWLLHHSTFQSNSFYVGGDSYGGKITPLLALEIADGNENCKQLFVNLKGYLVGNPVTSERIDISSQAPYAHGLGIISNELLKMILINCVGEDYLNPKKALCEENLKKFNGFVSEINKYSILEPKCADDSPGLKEKEGNIWPIIEKNLEFYYSLDIPDIDCANNRLLSYYWSNDNLTKEALNSKEGTVGEWHRCKQDSNNYTYNIPSCVPHHLNLTSRGYRALVYSGDHDLDVPFISTLEWIRSLNFSVVDDWRSWRAGGQVAGYTMLFSNNLTFATLKGGSHTTPDNRPLQSFIMFERASSSSTNLSAAGFNEAALDALGNVQVLASSTGKPVLFKDLWDQKEGIAVVALLRHFGCICCWELASELKDLIPRLDAAGVKLVAVGVGTPDNARILAERLPFPLDYLYADPHRKAYDVLGLYHGLGRTFFNPASAKVFSRFSSLRKAATNYTISATPDDKSGVLQQGGMLVFKGNKLLYARKDEGTGRSLSVESQQMLMDSLLLVNQSPNGSLSARRFPGAGATSFHRSSKLLHALSSRSCLGLNSQNPRKPLHLTLAADGEPAASRRLPPFPAQDDNAVFVGDEGIPLEGVIQFDKPSAPSSLLSRAILALLAGGDVLCLLAFSAIGRFSHGLPIFDVETIKTADPFVAGWVLSAYFLGGYGDDGKGMNGYGSALAATARSWLVGIPLGIGIRSATSGHIPETSFILISMGSTAILLLGWRALACKFLCARSNKDDDAYKRGNPFELFELLTSLVRRW